MQILAAEADSQLLHMPAIMQANLPRHKGLKSTACMTQTYASEVCTAHHMPEAHMPQLLAETRRQPIAALSYVLLQPNFKYPQ